jgi:glycosyltransferase involved in cell wall biosynthesis
MGSLRERRGGLRAGLRESAVNIALIGNYAPDRQESMLRYTELLARGLSEAGHLVTVAVPRQVVNRRGRPASGVWKWVGYLDKYCAGIGDIAMATRSADVVHICDHSNAPYVPLRPARPYVVTCHDLLAVRGALGEETDCPASFTGRILQRRILSGLGRAQAVACVSAATLNDARRLLDGYGGRLVVTPNALNHAYRRLPAAVTRRRLRAVVGLSGTEAYVLHVGSNLRRKNRECVLRAIAEVGSTWQGKIVFAGQALSDELRALARALNVYHRVVEVAKPDNDLLEALYNGALALVFPSRFEGFGWPILEAHACGCPVLCSDRAPFPEVADDAAIMCDADDHAGFARAIARLAIRPAERDALIARGLRNAARYDRAAMTARFVSLYDGLRAAA